MREKFTLQINTSVKNNYSAKNCNRNYFFKSKTTTL